MTPPKRAIFSLNVDSEIESLRAERTDYNREHEEKEKRVVDSKGPIASTGRTHIEIVRKPGEKRIERTVEGLGLGLADRDTDREETSEKNRGTTYTSTTITSKPAAKEPGTDINEQYDTSDL